MKERVDKDPNQEELVKLLRSDPLGRNIELVSFMDMLCDTKAPYTYFIDGDWGSGKTIFVKQLAVLIDAFRNCVTENDTGLYDKLKSITTLKSLHVGNSEDGKGSSGSISFFPVYYNAWENDHWPNPLPSLISTIAWGVGLDGKTKNDINENTAIEGLAGTILDKFGINRLFSELKGKDLLSEYSDHNEVRSKVKELISLSIPDEDTTLLLIIDELDRCRPTFAIELLEQVKTLFNHDNLITIYSVNLSQLTKTIEGCYGSGFDGNRYLSKFYDHVYDLKHPENCDYLTYLGLGSGYGRIHSVASEIADSFSMTLRDRNRFVESILNNKAHSIGGSTKAVISAEEAVLPALIAVKMMFPEIFKRISLNLDSSEFYDRIASLSYFWDCLDYFTDRYINPIFTNAKELSSDDRTRIRRDILSDFIILIFDTDHESAGYRRAQNKLFNVNYGFGSLSHIRNMIYC